MINSFQAMHYGFIIFIAALVRARASRVHMLEAVDPIGVNILHAERLRFILRGSSGFRMVGK